MYSAIEKQQIDRSNQIDDLKQQIGFNNSNLPSGSGLTRPQHRRNDIDELKQKLGFNNCNLPSSGGKIKKVLKKKVPKYINPTKRIPKAVQQKEDRDQRLNPFSEAFRIQAQKDLIKQREQAQKIDQSELTYQHKTNQQQFKNTVDKAKAKEKELTDSLVENLKDKLPLGLPKYDENIDLSKIGLTETLKRGYDHYKDIHKQAQAQSKYIKKLRAQYTSLEKQYATFEKKIAAQKKKIIHTEEKIRSIADDYDAKDQEYRAYMNEHEQALAELDRYRGSPPFDKEAALQLDPDEALLYEKQAKEHQIAFHKADRLEAIISQLKYEIDGLLDVHNGVEELLHKYEQKLDDLLYKQDRLSEDIEELADKIIAEDAKLRHIVAEEKALEQYIKPYLDRKSERDNINREINVLKDIQSDNNIGLLAKQQPMQKTKKLAALDRQIKALEAKKDKIKPKAKKVAKKVIIKKTIKKGGVAAGKQHNPWMAHVKKVKAKYPKLSYKEVLVLASSTYTKGKGPKAGITAGMPAGSRAGVRAGSKAKAKAKPKHKKEANPWIAHVKAYRAKHPQLSYREAMSQARASYK